MDYWSARDGFSAALVVGAALWLVPMLFGRRGELRQAEWSQVDLDRREPRYTVANEDRTPRSVGRSSGGNSEGTHPPTGHWRFVFARCDRRKPMTGRR
jgi:hypothetical protein